MKQRILLACWEQGPCPIKLVCCIGNMDRQDKQDKKLLHANPGFVSDKWRVPGAGKRLMTWLHFLNDCAEINKMLNASIKSLSTIHYPLST